MHISIHALCEEGDCRKACGEEIEKYFYPRPLRGGRRQCTPACRGSVPISIHALCEEGDFMFLLLSFKAKRFLSTPSARRATEVILLWQDSKKISIHALCEEGDACCCGHTWLSAYFYPRPLRGGRLSVNGFAHILVLFLSTPSARRATSCAQALS